MSEHESELEALDSKDRYDEKSKE
ncbi:hypothetical protein [Erwinia amylovora]|nr:hypothetical protein [Erwinia amylovora]